VPGDAAGRIARMRALVDALCARECAGRRTGTAGGRAARSIVREALRSAGLEPTEQPIPAIGGANVIAEIPGALPGAIVLGAHYDHLGEHDRAVFHGADDNAAAVAVLLEAAREARADPAPRRTLVFAAFDAEEPPHFLTPRMGSEVFAASRRDVAGMICMDTLGHALGPDALPDDVRRTLFVLGAEKAEGLAALVDRRAAATAGIAARRLDADVIPPLSDYAAFWRREIPFLFLTCGRSRVYHTPDDTPEKLDFAKLEATARLAAGLALDLARAPAPPRFRAGARDDAATVATLLALARRLAPLAPEAAAAVEALAPLATAAAARGLLAHERATIEGVIFGLEAALA
jgi:Zn-dependent M28 family amino/carboxypeptidase